MSTAAASATSQPTTPETAIASIRSDIPVADDPSRPRMSQEPGGETRIAIRGVTWAFYEHFVDGIPEHSHLRTAFDGRDLEIMTTGNIHEYFKNLIGRIVDILCEELNIQAGFFGETTWKRPEIARGIEADESYYFDPTKMTVAGEAVARRSNDVIDYPNPDLVVEIDISTSQVDRPGIYAAMGVTEVWRFDGKTFVIERLATGGTYAPAEQSCYLHVRPEEVLKWILDPAAWNRTDWTRRLRTWVREELAPRIARDRNASGAESESPQGTETA